LKLEVGLLGWPLEEELVFIDLEEVDDCVDLSIIFAVVANPGG